MGGSAIQKTRKKPGAPYPGDEPMPMMYGNNQTYVVTVGKVTSWADYYK